MHNPTRGEYRVRKGDSLSRIAQRFYGDAGMANEIARANRLPNRDLILVGMELRLPRSRTPLAHPPLPLSHAAAPYAPPLTPEVHPMGALQPARSVAFPPMKYTLDKSQTQYGPQFDVTVKVSGELTVNITNATVVSFDVSDLKSPRPSAELKTTYDSRVATATRNVSVKFDPASRTVEVSCGFTLASKLNGRAFVTTEWRAVPPNKLRYSISPKEIEGDANGMHFTGKVGFEIEIAFKGSPPPVTEPIRVWSTQGQWVVIGGLVLGGVAIILLDAGKDVLTGGVGLAESPLSWSAAAAMFSQASALAH